MLKAKSFFLVIPFILTSCAGMKEAWIANNCNYNAAYEKGSNDREALGKMDSSMYASCPEAQKEAALKGYREGYEKARQAENNEVQGTHIQIGGTQINIPGGSGKSFYCSLYAFGAEFSAFGATRLEATAAVKEKCKQKNNEIHCQDVKCKKNI